MDLHSETVDAVLDGLKTGRDPGIPPENTPESCDKNYVAPNKYIDVFRDIVDGYYTGFLSGPFDPKSKEAKETYLAPIGTVIKLFSNKDRVIHNLSHNKHLFKAVNAFIKDKDRVVYNTIRNIVEYFVYLGPDGLVSTWDMFEAYRQVKIKKSCHKYLGIKWAGKIYRYTCLPFGLASAPKLYSEFAETIRQITTFRKPNLWTYYTKQLLYNYLDDFWAGHTNPTIAWAQFFDFLLILDELGIPTQWRKVTPPSSLVKLLGFMFDIKKQLFYVSQGKVEKICDAIDQLINDKDRTRSSIAQ